jgi:hypothetical protein
VRPPLTLEREAQVKTCKHIYVSREMQTHDPSVTAVKKRAIPWLLLWVFAVSNYRSNILFGNCAAAYKRGATQIHWSSDSSVSSVCISIVMQWREWVAQPVRSRHLPLTTCEFKTSRNVGNWKASHCDNENAKTIRCHKNMKPRAIYVRCRFL